MKLLRISSLSLLVVVLWLGSSPRLAAQQSAKDLTQPRPAAYTRAEYNAVANSESKGIRELIDNRYRTRYKEWKDEFLSTEIGQIGRASCRERV